MGNRFIIDLGHELVYLYWFKERPGAITVNNKILSCSRDWIEKYWFLLSLAVAVVSDCAWPATEELLVRHEVLTVGLVRFFGR